MLGGRTLGQCEARIYAGVLFTSYVELRDVEVEIFTPVLFEVREVEGHKITNQVFVALPRSSNNRRRSSSAWLTLSSTRSIRKGFTR